ncbi:hypothetical protein BQ8794_100043 [Mesorhizobium prunaredense]|uniref:Uncharacterized protein n=1 Tax=Mesorhizobium prunaredense TaxID=1631249 RepID=A0A1R3UZU8_9HYPH|nr:hypothetical protein [Mesorhizobium prunaredense]SIT53152.1 hypothetical protein BQ8794_100043 [Mesorhizobium prunaredense]
MKPATTPKAVTNTVSFTRDQMVMITEKAVFAFYRRFERRPTEQEQAALVSCLTRYFLAPDAPSNRLQ